MNYAHNNQRLKTIQHNIEQTLNKASKIKDKITPTTQEVELVPRRKMLPAEVN